MRFFGHTKPLRVSSPPDKEGEIIGSTPAPVKVKTREPLGHAYGVDHDKRLVLTAHPCDVIGLRPERTRRELYIRAQDLYSYLVRLAAGRAQLEKARARKQAKRIHADRRALRRAEKRLTR